MLIVYHVIQIYIFIDCHADQLTLIVFHEFTNCLPRWHFE